MGGLQFSPDGHKIWGVLSENSPVDRWEIIEEGESSVMKLQPVEATAWPPEVVPWWFSHDYQVNHNGWILSPTQKRLLWLPHHWQSNKEYRKWGGQFLGLFHPDLAEVVILKFSD